MKETRSKKPRSAGKQASAPSKKTGASRGRPSSPTKKPEPRQAPGRTAPKTSERSAAPEKSKKSRDRGREVERQQREGDKKLRPKPITPPPNPSDLERPAPNEPVRIQPPTPRFANGRGTPVAETSDEDPPLRDEETSPANVDSEARAAEMRRERQRLRDDPERTRGVDRAPNANRWVQQRANQPRGGRWQLHGHSFRGR